MIGPRQSKTVFVLIALLILALAFPAAAGAYIARSAQEAITGYGMARSQPQTQDGPAAPSLPNPQPEKPVTPADPPPAAPASPPSSSDYTFNGGSFGLARSGSRSSLYNPAPQAPPEDPVSPPEQPEIPEQPEPGAPPAPTVIPEEPPSGEKSFSLNPQEQQLLDLVNRERADRGLAPLQLNAQLTRLARLKSQDMIDHNYFAHESPTYGRSGDMLRAAGVNFSMAAENIGIGGSINAIFNAFMNSSGHRNKIVSSRYTQTGVGVIYQPGRGYLVTQLFVQPR